MTDRERYEKLDDIGFVGFQDKNRTRAQEIKDAEKTSHYIKVHKARMEREAAQKQQPE